MIMSPPLKRPEHVLKVFYELETFLWGISLQPHKTLHPAAIPSCYIWQWFLPRVMSSIHVLIEVQTQIQISVTATGDDSQSFPGTQGRAMEGLEDKAPNSPVHIEARRHSMSQACPSARSRGGSWPSGLPASISTQTRLLKPLWISCGNPSLCPSEKETIIAPFFLSFFFQEESSRAQVVLVRDSINTLAGKRKAG